MANGQNFNEVVTIIETVCELAVSSGLVAAAVRFIQSKGVDIHATLNNQFVQAAFNAGRSVLVDMQKNGANLHDPKVMADAIAIVTNSLGNTQPGPIKSLGATVGDVERIAADQTRAAVTVVAPVTPIALPAVLKP